MTFPSFSRKSSFGPSSLGLALTLAGVFLCAAPPGAWAQDPGAPPPPPPGFEPQGGATGAPLGSRPPPPAGYVPPPAGYAPPPDAAGPPAGYPALPGAPPKTWRDMPQELPYSEGDPVPYGYHPDTQIRKGLVIGGAVTLGSLYLLSASIASVADDVSTTDEFTPLYFPVVGPFITIGTADAEGSGTFILLVDGVGQSAGLAMLIAGLASPRSVLVRNDLAEVRLSPVIVGDGQLGIGLAGRM